LVQATVPVRAQREAALRLEYLRVMRFVYQKEFIAQRSSQPADAVAELYRSRGLSTDTAVEAGYLVYLGLGVIRALDPARKVRRVLIIGPGLDLAPRTGLVETGSPESYQPWAVIDALLGLGLSRADDLEVVAADINPRVVDHLRRAATAPPLLTLVSEIRATDSVAISAEYRDYFAGLGPAVGDLDARPILSAREGHLAKTVRVKTAAARTLRPAALDIVTEHLEAPAFDLVIATNILPYFDDGELMLALANIAAMLAPGGVFVHNEPRSLVGDVTEALGLPFEHSRHAIIATVRGAPAPLGDSVFLHRKR
jgi:SAM-dependent methyltransferase